MGKALAAAVVALAACGGDTGIVLEVSMSAELVAELDESQADFETLRIWVGHATDEPGFFRGSGDAFMETPRDRAGLVAPFRYYLEPTGELTAIGPLVFAAAVGDDPDDQRLPFRITGFAASDAPMGFADGEVRVVALELAPPDGVFGTIDDRCIVWGMNSGEPQRIAPDDDVDCDGAPVEVDCDDRDPSRNELDRDGDGFSSCDGDCLDDPRPDTPWLDPATVNPGATEGDPLACDHVDQDCDGACQSPSVDADDSGSTACGAMVAEGGVCDVTPADCDESRAGNQPLGVAAPEACNARDDACDGFLPPPLPCVIAHPDDCHWGEVACDEREGEYEGENDELKCRPLPAGFSDFDAPPAVCMASTPVQCLETGDPIGCAFETATAPRASCHVAARGACRHDRVELMFPTSGEPPVSCEWLVVGGFEQAEWEIGFLEANAPDDAVPESFTSLCRPQLAVRARTMFPSPRTVLLLVRSPDDEAFGVRPLLVHLTDDALAECDGTLTCEFAIAN